MPLDKGRYDKSLSDQSGVVIGRDTIVALIVVVRAVRTERLGLRALDEVTERLTLALDAQAASDEERDAL